MAVDPVYVRHRGRFASRLGGCVFCSGLAASIMRGGGLAKDWSALFIAVADASLVDIHDRVPAVRDGTRSPNPKPSAKINRVHRWLDGHPVMPQEDRRIRKDGKPGRDMMRRVDWMVQIFWADHELKYPSDHHAIAIRRHGRPVRDLRDWLANEMAGFRERFDR